MDGSLIIGVVGRRTGRGKRRRDGRPLAKYGYAPGRVVAFKMKLHHRDDLKLETQLGLTSGHAVYAGIGKCRFLSNRQQIRGTRCARFRPPIKPESPYDGPLLKGFRQHSAGQQENYEYMGGNIDSDLRQYLTYTLQTLAIVLPARNPSTWHSGRHSFFFHSLF